MSFSLLHTKCLLCGTHECETSMREEVVPFMKISNSKIQVTKSKGSCDHHSELFLSFLQRVCVFEW